MFLSTAYLTSLATLVLIIYVINPPVKDAIQGAYFVGIFMSGIIFGGGALIFQDITEGLGCLLGGFALSMWFLTLKPGGLITSTGGKAIFIAAFCVVCWSLSFSHYTRAYGLIGSTSFAGSTALVLGIDCFSKAGLKEFWVYIWDLNDNLFPLNTSTYPITRGIRVEIVVIILGTIVGVISQVRLWRLVQNRQKAREAIKVEDERRRDAVEEALGRHLERQNDKDRSEWEKRYGDRLNTKRNTVLWSDAHGEKRLSSASITEVGSSQNSESTDSLEMTHMALTGQKLSKNKRQSNITVQAIPEVEEEEHNEPKPKAIKRDSVLAEHSPRLDNLGFVSQPPTTGEFIKIPSADGDTEDAASPSLRPQMRKPSSKRIAARLHLEPDEDQQKRNSIQPLTDLKRRSIQSLRSKSPANGEKSPNDPEFSESREALVRPADSTVTHSRASSVAATLDEENEKLEMPILDSDDNVRRSSRPPQIVISSVHGLNFGDQLRASFPEPASPSGLSEGFEDDPEAIVRPLTAKAHGIPDFDYGLSSKRNSGSKSEGIMSSAEASQMSSAEGLTKGALDKVPSQMSNIVLSYRTNEWAKHIATAEAPIFEEPDPIVVEDKEPPTHLAIPGSPTPEEPKAQTQTVEKPLELPAAVVSVAPFEAGVKVNPELQPTEKALSRPTSITESTPPAENAPSRTTSQVSVSLPKRRSVTDPVQQAVTVPKSTRRISNPLQRQGTLQGTIIDENTATNFATGPSGPNRSTSSATNRNSQQYTPGVATPELVRSSSSGQHYPSAFKRQAAPTYSHQNYSTSDIRPSTAHTSTPYSSNSAAVKSETRLSNYNNTHQPLQRNNTDSSRREALMTDWRAQIANSSNNNNGIMPQVVADTRHVQMVYDSQAAKARKEQEKYMKAKKDAAWDQTMRTQGMIDAHREVLKKMQSQANKKLTQ